MLVNIKIENFAIIGDMEIHFHPGLNVLTGESGAGKSMIVDSLNFALGERTKSVKIAADKTVRVQARFEMEGKEPEVLKRLRESGIVEKGSNELILTRKMYPSGRNLYHINGEMVPLKTYRVVGRSLMDIHGQGDSRFLLVAENQRMMLDMMTGGPADECLRELDKLYREFNDLKSEIDHLRAREIERNREIDWLEHEIQEIESAGLKPGEEEELQRRKLILENAEQITESSSFIHEALSGENGLLDRLGRVSRELNKWIKFDSEMEKELLMLDESQEQLQEISFICLEKGESVEFSQEALDRINGRQHLLELLKRKYGAAVEDILEYLEKSRKKLESLRQASSKIEVLERELDNIRKKWLEISRKLSQLRKKTSAKLEKTLTAELSTLGMKKASFKVMFNSEEGDSVDKTEKDFSVTPCGLDRIEFLIGPNPGVPPRPLNLIASGGELSRIMLAFRSLFSRLWNFSTLVLDEIDVGLGGVSAGVVGEKLLEIALDRQVICITHLPVIASLADNHFRIEKETKDGKTRAYLTLVSGSERIEEVMRMLAGDEYPGEVRRLAEKFLQGK